MIITLYIFLTATNLQLYKFEDELDSRHINWVYAKIERISVRTGNLSCYSLPLSKGEIETILNEFKQKDENDTGMRPFDMQMIETLEKEIECRKVNNKNILLGADLGGKGWGAPSGEREFFSCLSPWVQVEVGNIFYGYNKTTIFNEQRKLKDPIPYYDPDIQPDFILHNWEQAPVVGEKEVLEVKADRAYGVFNLSSIRVEIGKDKVRWGPGCRGTLFISGFSSPIDFVYNIKTKIGSISLYAFNAGIQDSLELKRMSAQRVEICLHKKMIIGISEGVLHTKEDIFKYFNPLGLYYITERRGRSGDDNLMATVDISIVPKRGTKIYFEFLNDDYVIWSKEVQPSLYGILGGLYFAMPKSDLRIEATYVNRWTYAHRSGITHWTYGGIPLGFWAGSDVIDLYLEYIRWLSAIHGVSISYENLAHGEGKLEIPWEWEKEEFPNARGMKSPTECPDRRNILGVKAFLNGSKLSISGGIWGSIIKNYWNSDKSVTQVRAKLAINVFI
ncbi:MAG: capsule assembly Wzi family protein [bacterium]|nr:capsule assembly Wzi family protein [bacterium]